MERSEFPVEGAAATRPASPTRMQKVYYSLGQAAQSGGFDTAVGFVFFYYSVVLGLSGALVGAALAIGLAFDAVVDPFIGSWSDNLKSRLGRRLPLMMAAIPPTVISVGLLFSPPQGLAPHLLFAWLVVFSVASRIAWRKPLLWPSATSPCWRRCSIQQAEHPAASATC